jgi:SHS family lactate transporter-like MFS transporter
MIAALVLSFLTIPAWTFSGPLVAIAIAAFVMQIGVQGAWGVIPAHLNELSPDQTRGLLPGLAYQLGILIAAPVNNIEYFLRSKFGYSWALAGFETVNIALLIAVLALGRERKGKSFLAT